MLSLQILKKRYFKPHFVTPSRKKVMWQCSEEKKDSLDRVVQYINDRKSFCTGKYLERRVLMCLLEFAGGNKKIFIDPTDMTYIANGVGGEYTVDKGRGVIRW